MKAILLMAVMTCLLSNLCHSQVNFSDETKKYIEFNDPITVFKNALLIDGKGNPAKAHQTVIIINGQIDWVGDDAKALIPKSSRVIDLNGKTLMPGLVMMHEHMYISAFSLEPRYLNLRQLPVTFPRLDLASGATTIRTTGSIEPYSDLRIKKDIDSGTLPGPFVELTAPYIEGKNAIFPQMKANKTPEEVTSFVNYWADQGFTSFKAYMDVDKPLLKAAIDAAHKRNLKVTAHLCAVTYREAAQMGIDSLEHGFSESTDFVTAKKENECPDGLAADRSLATLDTQSESVRNFLQFLIEKKVSVDSTLAVFEGATTTHPPQNEEVLSAMSPDTRDFYLRRVAALNRVAKQPWDFDGVFAKTTKMEKMFSDMGGLLSVGTDPTGNGGVLAGYGTWRAIELLVEADGFTPLEAIKIATRNGAIAIGMEKSRGTIEKGKSADLLVIDGDPSKNISDIRKVQYVFKNGVGYHSKKLFDSVRGKVGFN